MAAPEPCGWRQGRLASARRKGSKGGRGRWDPGQARCPPAWGLGSRPGSWIAPPGRAVPGAGVARPLWPLPPRLCGPGGGEAACHRLLRGGPGLGQTPPPCPASPELKWGLFVEATVEEVNLGWLELKKANISACALLPFSALVVNPQACYPYKASVCLADLSKVFFSK